MHLPDGILPWWQSLIYFGISLPFIAIAFKKLRKQLGETSSSTISLLAAGIFVIQTIHFPIPGGTCAHVVGAAIVAYFLGAWGVIAVASIVLLIQATFGEGGITAYGANVLSMGIIAGFVAAYILKIGKKRAESKRSSEISEESKVPKTMLNYLVLASFVSTLLTGVVAGIEVAISGTIPFWTVVPIMFAWHIFLGIIDAIMTVSIIKYISQNSPEIVSNAEFSVTYT